jgi:hypothetical protein
MYSVLLYIKCINKVKSYPHLTQNTLLFWPCGDSAGRDANADTPIRMTNKNMRHTTNMHMFPHLSPYFEGIIITIKYRDYVLSAFEFNIPLRRIADFFQIKCRNMTIFLRNFNVLMCVSILCF